MDQLAGRQSWCEKAIDSIAGRGYTSGVMPRRFATVLLVAAVALAGVMVCPRGVLSCVVAMQAKHDCCGPRTALRASECCCRDGAQPAPMYGAGGSGAQESQPAKMLVNSALHAIPLTTAHLTYGRSGHRDHGLSPPDTLVTRHTALLL